MSVSVSVCVCGKGTYPDSWPESLLAGALQIRRASSGDHESAVDIVANRETFFPV